MPVNKGILYLVKPERLWQVLRNLSSEFSHVVFVNSILTPSELDAYFREGEHDRIAES